MKILLVLVCMFFTSGVYARCVSNGHGNAACGGNGNGVHTINNNNNNGVNHRQTRNGGKAYTKNGKGVVRGPGGTTCVRTANNQGCR